MGFSLGLSGSKEKSKTKTTPWQANDLRFAFDESRKLYDQGPYQGPYAAPIDTYQQQGYDMTPGAAQQFQQAGQGIYGAGQQAMGSMGGAADYFNRASQGGFMQGYQNPMAGGMDQNVVGSYVDNDLLQRQIDAANRDTVRGLNEQQLPGARFNAAVGGMAGATTQGVAEGIATRGAQDRMGDVSAAMRGNAYGMGVQADMTRQGMGQQAIMAGLGNEQFGASGMAGMGTTGANMMQSGANMMGQVPGMYAGMGDYMQGLDQNQIEGQMNEFNAPWDIINRYYGIVGDKSWGGETKSKGRSATATLGYE